jgi:hypothetical protein
VASLAPAESAADSGGGAEVEQKQQATAAATLIQTRARVRRERAELRARKSAAVTIQAAQRRQAARQAVEARRKQSRFRHLDFGHLNETDPCGHFARYDTDHNGTVSRSEIDSVLGDLGYDADPAYGDGVMQMFATSATAGGVVVLNLEQFMELWAHLDGDSRCYALCHTQLTGCHRMRCMGIRSGLTK